MYLDRLTGWIVFLLGTLMFTAGLVSVPIALISQEPEGVAWMVIPGAVFVVGGLMMIVRRMRL